MVVAFDQVEHQPLPLEQSALLVEAFELAVGECASAGEVAEQGRRDRLGVLGGERRRIVLDAVDGGVPGVIFFGHFLDELDRMLQIAAPGGLPLEELHVAGVALLN